MAEPESALAGSTFSRSTGQLSERVGAEAVVLDIDRDRYYGISASAARLWAMLEAPRTMRELVDALVAAYDIDQGTARADVSRFIDELLRLGLIRQMAKP